MIHACSHFFAFFLIIILHYSVDNVYYMALIYNYMLGNQSLLFSWISQPEWNVPMVILRIIPFWRVSTVLAEVWIFIYFSPREGFTKLNVRINKDVKLYCAGFFLLVKYINYKYHSRSIFKRFPGRHQHVIKLFIFFLTQMSHAYHKCT